MTATSPSGPRRAGARAATLLVGLGVALVGAELALRWRPQWLPAAYRNTFPARGVEFFEPGLLARTPIDAMPWPLVPAPFSGDPPADLFGRVVVIRRSDGVRG